MTSQERYRELENKIKELSSENSGYGDRLSFSEQREALIRESLAALPAEEVPRFQKEIHGYGPLEDILKDEITEILVNDPKNIWFESRGRLFRHDDGFFSEESYEKILERICLEAGSLPTLEVPMANGHWRGFRLHAIRAPLSRSPLALSLRAHPKNPWALESLRKSEWCDDFQLSLLRQMIQERRNFLIVGSTGSGKTSVLNALLGELDPAVRCGIIEDTDEISCPAGASFKLLTREAAAGGLPAVDQGELVRQCLRMRPDRLVMGEIRGAEAKDFLMALSTGHAGSFGTLHADDPAQALLRLEMLIQMGAPHWNLGAIRRLIRLGLQNVVVVFKNKNGERRLKGIHRLTSLEDSGFLLEQEA